MVRWLSLCVLLVAAPALAAAKQAKVTAPAARPAEPEPAPAPVPAVKEEAHVETPAEPRIEPLKNAPLR